MNFKNEVFVGDTPCIIDNYYTKETQISCKIKEENLTPLTQEQISNKQFIKISVKVNGVALDCKTNCNFNYYISRSPYIQAVVPNTVYAGQDVRLYGFFMVSTTDNIEEIRFGDKYMCDWSIYEQTLSYWSRAQTVKCKINEDIETGDYSLRVKAKTEAGISKIFKSAFSYDLDSGQSYNLRVHPRIDSLSASSGYTTGSIITISGQGFGVSKEAVKVEAVMDQQNVSVGYEILSVKDDEIKVKLKEDQRTTLNDQKIYLGGAGLQNTVTPFTNSIQNFQIQANYPDNFPNQVKSIILTTETMPKNNQYAQRSIGVFKAPEAGDYTFRISADDQAVVKYGQVDFTQDFDESTLTDLCPLMNSWSDFRNFFRYNDDQKCTVTLTQNTYYYIVILHKEFNGDDHFTLAVNMPHQDAVNRQNYQPLISEIQINNESIKEIIEVSVWGATGGTFSMTFLERNGDGEISFNKTTNEIAYDATQSQFRSGLRSAKSWNVSVVREMLDANGNVTNSENDKKGYKWIATFGSRRSEQIIPFIHTNNLQGAKQIKAERTQEASPPITGQFKIQIGSETTSILNHNSNWVHVMDSLRVLKKVQQDGVQVTQTGDDESGRKFQIIWNGLRTQETIQIVESTIAGGPPANPATIQLVSKQPLNTSNLFFYQIPSKLLSTFHPKPQIHLKVNNLRSACPNDNCNYEYLPSSEVPEIESFQIQNDTLEITLKADVETVVQNFVWESGNIEIYFAGRVCQVAQSITLPKVNCQLLLNANNQPDIPAGNHSPEMYLRGKGRVKVSQQQLFPLTMNSVNPDEGSLGGGTLLTITGQGFDENSIVKVDGQICQIQSQNNVEIKCLSPLTSGSVDKTVSLTLQNGQNVARRLLQNGGRRLSQIDATNSLNFNYKASLTPTINSLTPNNSSPVLKKDLIIAGTGFGTDSANTKVLLKSTSLTYLPTEQKEQICNIINQTDVQITCRLSGGHTGSYQVYVVRNSGNSVEGNNDFEYKITVTSISQANGSVNGGTLLMINGTNFSSVQSDNQVIIGPVGETYFCRIQTVNETQITCITDPLKEDTGIKDVSQILEVRGKLVEQAICQGNCQFTYQTSVTPTVTEVTPLTGVKDTVVTVKGSQIVGGNTKMILKNGDQEISINGVIAANNQDLDFTLPSMEGGNYTVQLVVEGKGYATIPPNTLIEYQFKIDSISPTSGAQGGTKLSVLGSGFKNTDQVYIRNTNKKCLYQEYVSHEEIKCVTIQLNKNEQANVYVVRGDQEILSPQKFLSLDEILSINSIPTTHFTSGQQIQLEFHLTKDLPANPVYQVYLRSTVDFSLIEATSVTNVDKIFTANFEKITVGKYLLAFHLDGKGFFKLTTPSPQEITVDFDNSVTASTQNSSYGGGAILNITGNSLSNAAHYNVKICGQEAQIVSSNDTGISVKTPQFITVEVQDEFHFSQSQHIKPSSIIALNGFNQSNVNDDDYYTSFTSSSDSCEFTLDFGENFLVEIEKIKIFPALTYSDSTINYEIQFSVDGQTFLNGNQPANQSVNPAEWTTYQPENNEIWKYRFVKFKGGKCPISEFRIYGSKTLNQGNFSLQQHSCDVIITADQYSKTLSNVVNYQQSSTVKVTEITPKMGTSAGGEDITIKGDNLSQNCTIKFDQVECVFKSMSGQDLICTTGARNQFMTPQMTIECPDGLGSPNGNSYLYIDRWSESRTWGGELPPTEGESIHVPAGQSLLVDVSPPKLKLVTIEGLMIFEDVNDMTFDAHYIMINGGKMQAGTPEVPRTNKLTITLHGKKTDQHLPGMGNKLIGVMNGHLDLHGTPRTPTWTMLDSTAVAGSDTATLITEVDWKVGEEVIFAITGVNKKEFEIKKIKSISANKKTITLETPLQFNHYASELEYNGVKYQLRGEVGLLSRNILVKGDDSSTQDKYGVHIMLRGDEGKVRGRFSYIEVDKCGQAFQMGRYPIHFHMIGNVVGSYLEGVSVHHSNNRGTTIHGVHGLQIRKGVYYLHLGHGIFWEDSIESNNIVEDTLVMGTKVSSSLLFSDLSPGAFWITRPKNTVRRNHAVGSESFGFWYDLPNSPTGPSQTKGICPVGEKLGIFEDNVSHGNSIGLRIYPQFLPRTHPCLSLLNTKKQDITADNPPQRSVFKNALLWNNSLGFFTKKIGTITLENFAFISNGTGISYANPQYPTKADMPTLKDSIIVSKTPVGDMHGLETSKAFQLGAKDGFIFDNVKLINFNNKLLMRTCNSCDPINTKKAQLPMTPSFFKNLQLENSTFSQVISFNDPEFGQDIIYDETGSLMTLLGVNFSSGFIQPYQNHLNNDSCVIIDDTTKCSVKCIVCPMSVTSRRVEIVNQENEMKGYTLKILNKLKTAFNNDIQVDTNFSLIDYIETKDGFKGWAFPLQLSQSYNLHFNKGVDFDKLLIRNNAYWKPGDYVSPSFNVTGTNELYDVFFTGVVSDDSYFTNKLMTPSTQSVTSASALGENYYSSVQKKLEIAINGNERGQALIKEVICRNNCPDVVEPEVPSEEKFRKWSVVEDWDGNPPVEGQDAEIKAEWKMIVDVTTVKVNNLSVKGKLYFFNQNSKITLNAKNIIVYNNGLISVGSENEQLDSKAEIILHGMKNDPQVVLSPLLTPSNKSLIILGQFSTFIKPKKSWTKLKANAVQGQTVLDVFDVMDWEIGDSIVISSTSQNENEIDVLTITAINGTRIETQQALSYNHYGSPIVKSTSHGDLDMRAEVGLLSRQFKIKGSDEDGWGCHVQVAGFTDLTTQANIQGGINIANVQFENCGQRDSENAALDLVFLNLKDHQNSIKDCSFTEGSGWGININGSKKIEFENNVIHNSQKYGLRIKASSALKIYTNIFIGVKTRPWYSNVTAYDLIIGVFYDDDKDLIDQNIVFKENIVSSSSWFGFVVPGMKCTVSQNNFLNNKAHSNRVGWFTVKVNSNCQQYMDFTAYRNWEEGFVNREMIMDQRVMRFIMSDNGNSIAINGGSETRKDFPKSTIRDSAIFGKSLNDCTFCYKNQRDCETNGIYTSLFESVSFTFSFNDYKLPMHNATFSNYLWGGHQLIDNVEFQNFQANQNCNNEKAFVIRANNFIQDTSAYVELKNIKMTNVDHHNKFFFANHTRLMHPEFCQKRDCTGIYNTLIDDSSGVFDIQQQPKQYFGFNKPIAQDGNCTFVEQWNGHQCLRNYQLISIKKTASARQPIITPLYVSVYKDDADVAADKKFKNTVDNEIEIPVIIKRNSYHKLEFSQSFQSNNIYKLDSYRNDWAVFQQHSEDPATLSIKVKGVEVDPIVLQDNQEIDWSSYNNQCGKYVFHPSNSTIFWIMNAKSNCIVTVVKKKTVRIAMRLDLDVSDFYSNIGETSFKDKISALLGVHPSQVKIVGIRKGSTIVDFYVENDESENQTTEQNNQNLINFQKTLREKQSEFAENIGAKILNLTSEIVIPDDIEDGYEARCRFYNYDTYFFIGSSKTDLEVLNAQSGKTYLDINCPTCNAQQSCQTLLKQACEQNKELMGIEKCDGTTTTPETPNNPSTPSFISVLILQIILLWF